MGDCGRVLEVAGAVLLFLTNDGWLVVIRLDRTADDPHHETTSRSLNHPAAII